MAEVEIRPAVSTDIPDLVKLDHGCETTHIWQMNNGYENGQIEVRFREIRLPRSLRLNYPRSIDSMPDTWTKHSLFLVARLGDVNAGFLILDIDKENRSAWVSDLVVSPTLRRQGIASALLISAQDWLKKQGITRITLISLVKNHAVIELARKLRYKFSGFAEEYYSNGDLAIFFTHTLGK